MAAAKRYRPWTPGQQYLLAPSPRDWLPESDLAYFIIDVVGELDLDQIESRYQAKDPRGTSPYDPRMMVALLLYGYCVGVRSSRKIEAATYRDVAFRVIAAEQHPDHSRISEFRRIHFHAFAGIFAESVRLASEAGLVKLGSVALDGTKVAANASKHKAMSYERMGKSEDRLRAEIEAILRDAERIDQEEDALYGPDRRGDELPDELANRTTRLKKIREAKAALKAEAARARAETLEANAKGQEAKAQSDEDPAERARAATRAKKARQEAEELRSKAGDDDDDEPGSGTGDLPRHRVKATRDGDPDPKAQRNFTDPDSRMMKGADGWVQGYNVQMVVDAEAQVIVAQAVTNQPPDCEHLTPMMDRVKETTGSYPKQALADAGYWSAGNATALEARGIDGYISTRRRRRGEDRPPDDGNDEARARMREKVESPEGSAIYARRKAIVEPVFGQTKDARGIRSFLVRGLHKVRGECDLISAAHNLLKVYRAGLATA